MSVYCGNLFGGGQGYADKCGVSRGYMGDGELDQCHSCQKKEIESLRKDAERYRFLMQSEISDDHSPTAGFYVIYEDGRGFGDLLCGDEASEAIDAAISSPESHS